MVRTFIGFALVLVAVVSAQGQNAPAAAPTLRDGRPDLSGIWRIASDRYLMNLAADGIDVPFQPWAAAIYKQRQTADRKDRPSARCLPRGVPAAMLARQYPWKIVQTPGVVMVLFNESLHYRQIFTDGRGFPEDPSLTWFGYSVGRWEGDALVVETIGLNDQTWIDDGGHPHSEALRVTERFRRRTAGAMDVAITIDDPKAYARPWTATVRFERVSGPDLGEQVCGVHSSR